MSSSRPKTCRLSIEQLETRLTPSAFSVPSGLSQPLLSESALVRSADHGDEAPPVNLQSFQRPAPGKITSAFGPRDIRQQVPGASDFHKGVDIGGKKGQVIRATEAGKVVFVNREPGNSTFGSYVVPDHGLDERGRRIYSLSAHASEVLSGVEVGASVDKGQAIARIGNTSSALRIKPHLHFEIRTGSPIRPATFGEWLNQTDAINPRFTGAFSSPKDTVALLKKEDKQYRATQFDGLYVGRYSGTVTLTVAGVSTTETVSGELRFHVQSRRITVTVPTSGTGSLSPTGRSAFSARGSVAGNCRFGGGFETILEGGVLAGGGWSCRFAGGSAQGSWSAARSA